MGNPISLYALIDRYAENHEEGLSKGAKDQLRWAVGAWQRWAGKPLTTDDFQRETFNGYVDWLKENRAADTVRTRRGNLLTLWRFAFEEGLTDNAPRKIRRLKKRRTIPTAWTPEEVDHLLEMADQATGRFATTQIPRDVFWRSLILTAWDSALRLGDLLALERTAIVGEKIVVRQSKTGDDVLVMLRPQTLAEIERCCADPPRRLIWPLWCRRDQFYVAFGRLVSDAKIRPGTFKWIRRASITAVERQQRGAGTQHAGHRTRAVTEANYIDPRQLDEDRPQPPPLKRQAPDEPPAT